MEYIIKVDTNVSLFVTDLNPTGRKTILFVHGWPLNHNAFEYQFVQLPCMGYRCIGLDMRGFGQSSKPWKGYDYNRLADDLYYVVRALHLNNFILAGHSMGGATAIRYMARYNGYCVSKLALFAAAAPSLTARPDFPWGLPKEDVTHLIRLTYSDRPQMLRKLEGMFFCQDLSQAYLDSFFLMGLAAAGWSTAECAYTFRDESLFADLGKIRVPTLILHGIHDQISLYALAEALNKGIANSKLVPFEQSGHGLFYEEREKFNMELAQFVG